VQIREFGFTTWGVKTLEYNLYCKVAILPIVCNRVQISRLKVLRFFPIFAKLFIFFDEIHCRQQVGWGGIHDFRYSLQRRF
jgi:hypothetical protein